MAHEIEFRNNEYSFAENQNNKEGLAWHRLGKRFDGPMSVEQAIDACRANYNVAGRRVANLTQEQLDAIMRGEAVTFKPEQIIENCKAITREDTDYTLGVTKDRYTIVQNKQAFDFIDFLTTGELGTKASIDAAGVLGKGERIFITAKFHDDIMIKGDSRMDMYAVFTNSFDGSSPVCCMITPIRVVCNNTLNAAFGNNSGRFTLRHTASITSKIQVNEVNMKNACETLNLMQHYRENLVAGCEKLGNVQLDETKVDHLIKDLFLPADQTGDLETWNYDITVNSFSTRYRNTVASVTNHVYNGIGQDEGQKMSGLWFVNGITTYFQNGEQSRDLPTKRMENKFKNMMGGTSYNVLNRANDLVLACA